MLKMVRLGSVLALSLCVSTLMVHSGDKAKDNQKEKGGAGNTDSKFVQKASESDLMEIATGKLASKQATDAKVREFAMKMVEDHTKSSEELAMIAKKHNLQVATEVSKEHKAKADKLSEAKGADFDVQYMTIQVKAHQEAIKLFKEQSQKGKNTDLNGFAAKSLPIIEHHHQMAQKILQTLSKGGTTKDAK